MIFSVFTDTLLCFFSCKQILFHQHCRLKKRRDIFSFYWFLMCVFDISNHGYRSTTRKCHAAFYSEIALLQL